MNGMQGVDAAAAAKRLLGGGAGARDLAVAMGVSEAELVAGHDGPEVVRLRADMRSPVMAVSGLGEVTAHTRNAAAVHEKTGHIGNITLGDVHGLVLNEAIDLRLFLGHWRHAFAV